jgi:hypothetical protein
VLAVTASDAASACVCTVPYYTLEDLCTRPCYGSLPCTSMYLLFIYIQYTYSGYSLLLLIVTAYVGLFGVVVLLSFFNNAESLTTHNIRLLISTNKPRYATRGKQHH